MQTFLRKQIPDAWANVTQIGQKYPSLFSHARKRGNEVISLHPGVLCRDFLMDQYLWTVGEVEFKGPVYGYHNVPDVNPSFPEYFITDRVAFMEKNLPGLNEIEAQLEISPTEIEKVENGYYVKGDPWWYTSTLHLSWYTQALRQMGAVEVNWKDMAASADSTFCQLKTLLSEVPFILKRVGWKTRKSPVTDTPYSIHDTSGCYQLWYYIKYMKFKKEQIKTIFNWTDELIEEIAKNGN